MKRSITTDFHSHILPGADHGSDGIETSLKQLDLISSYGIQNVVATPHFYPMSDNVSMFLKRREKTAKILKHGMRPGSPRVMLGAEVLICDGMERMEGVEKLTVLGTNCILLEMPMTRWSDTTFETVDAISRSGLRPVMAHIDRYDPKDIEELMKLDVLAQLNPDPFFTHRGKKFAAKWLRAGKVAAIGSDLHRVNEREYKDFITACEALSEYADSIENSMRRLLKGALTISGGEAVDEAGSLFNQNS